MDAFQNLGEEFCLQMCFRNNVRFVSFVSQLWNERAERGYLEPKDVRARGQEAERSLNFWYAV